MLTRPRSNFLSRQEILTLRRRYTDVVDIHRCGIPIGRLETEFYAEIVEMREGTRDLRNTINAPPGGAGGIDGQHKVMEAAAERARDTCVVDLVKDGGLCYL